MRCNNAACPNEIVGRNSRALYCCPNCKRQAEVARRAIKRTGMSPVHRGPNDGRSENRRAARLRRYYGITVAQYDSLLEKQGHKCAVCRKPSSESKTRLAVDHNHKTGEIRGLLCSHCNHRLVSRWKDGELLRRIADYVEQGTGWIVPKEFLTGRPKSRKSKKAK